jgi:hypothetical protein
MTRVRSLHPSQRDERIETGGVHSGDQGSDAGDE